MGAKVFFADLRYNSGVLANDAMPLGIAYMKAVMDRDLPEAQSQPFAYPDRLLQALRDDKPDVLMLTNYAWNESLGHFFATIAKQVNPNMLVVMGGPNFPLEPERQITYLHKQPDIDVYALGEGDFLATELVRRYLQADKCIKKFRAQELPSSVYRNSDGDVVRQPIWERHKELDDLPSPWLTGVQDGFFDGKLAPMIETNRGCPFTCTFCVEGTRYHTKVHTFSQERVREEIMYIGRRIRELSPHMRLVYITDSNYGMFERDAETSAILGEARKLFGWPTFIDATTGKNRPERVIKSLEKTSGALVLYHAVQSLDEKVLKNIKRENIKLEAYEALRLHLSGRGMRSGADLILGLPGESLASHMAAIDRMIDTGVTQMHNFQAMMLKGSEMETQESRNAFQFTTGFRVLPKNYDELDGQKVMETEEIIYSTQDMNFADYLTARKHHLACSMFWNDAWFEDPVKFAGLFGIKRSEWLRSMIPAVEADTGVMRKLLDDFVNETTNEIFPSREACVEFYSRPENYERLLSGEIGDNLMYKYRVMASFYYWPNVCHVAMQATKKLLLARGANSIVPDFEEFWEDFQKYIELLHPHGRSAEQILSPVEAEFKYDIRAWIQSELREDPSLFRLPKPELFRFYLSEDSERELTAALAVWPTTTKGLSKLVVRLRTGWQIRESVMVEGAREAVA